MTQQHTVTLEPLKHDDLVELAKMVKSFYGDARWITNATPEQRFAEEGRLLELARAALAKAKASA